MFHDGEIVFAARGIAEMGSGDMNFSLLQPKERLMTGAWGDHDIKMTGQQRDARVASGDQQPLLVLWFARENLRLRTVDDNRVGRGKQEMERRGGDSDGPVADAAKLYRLTGARRRDEVDGDGLGRGDEFGLETEELFDTDLEDFREM